MKKVTQPEKMKLSSKPFIENFRFWFTNHYEDKHTVVPVTSDTVVILEGAVHSGKTSIAADVLRNFMEGMMAFTDVVLYYSDEGDFLSKLLRHHIPNSKGSMDFHQVKLLSTYDIGGLIKRYKDDPNTGNKVFILFMDNIDSEKIDELCALKAFIPDLVIVATLNLPMSLMASGDKSVTVTEYYPQMSSKQFNEQQYVVALERNNQGIMMKTGDGTILQN